MKYIYDYLYLSIVFLGVIAIRFFSQRQFPSMRNKIFSTIIVVALADMALDIASSVVIERALTTPVWLTSLVCYLFYSLQCIFPTLMLLYIFTLARKRRWLRPPGLLILLAPTTVTLAMLYSNLFTKLFFYVDPVQAYVRGPFFIVLYVNIVGHIIVACIVTLLYKKEILPLERRTVFIFLSMVAAMTFVQYLFPEYLVTGPAIAVSIMLMYIVMQKPEDMIDAISGAFNNAALMIFSENSIVDGKPFSLILLDLMYMRRINRLFGMDFGSKTLETVVEVMSKAAHGGWVFRTLGNVFVLANFDQEKNELAYAELCEYFSQSMDVHGMPMQLTATILYIPDPGDIHTVEDLSECLESALNSTGRGEHCVISSELLLKDQRREEIDESLSRAVSDGSIRPVFQPIYSVTERRFVSVEALARFRHSALGDVPPSEFIPLAEKNGLILQLDRQIIRNVCQFLSTSGANIEAVEINLSPVEFISEHLCTRIIETVREYGVSPGRIWFEITESSTNVDRHLLSAYMERLCAEGFRFALDDYGVGYSNISRIMDMPFSLVKLDRSMMLGAMAEKRSAIILDSTIKMLKALDLRTLVEGVETEEQAEAMCRLGVDYIQGFYYARPMPMSDAAEFMRRYDGDRS